MLIDEINMTEINNLHDFIKMKLQSFKIDDLCGAFDAGKMFYSTTHNLNPDSKLHAVGLGLASLGIFQIAKTIKAQWRTPRKSEITEENKVDVLKTFLSTNGGKDLYSLKFLVIAPLCRVKAESHLEAAMIIDEVMDQLKLTPVLTASNIELKALGKFSK